MPHARSGERLSSDLAQLRVLWNRNAFQLSTVAERSLPDYLQTAREDHLRQPTTVEAGVPDGLNPLPSQTTESRAQPVKADGPTSASFALNFTESGNGVQKGAVDALDYFVRNSHSLVD